MKFEPRDLVDSVEAADIIGVGSSNSVSTYRRRYGDFPVPVIEKGKCVLWMRSDIERWSAGHRRQRGPEPRARKR